MFTGPGANTCRNGRDAAPSEGVRCHELHGNIVPTYRKVVGHVLYAGLVLYGRCVVRCYIVRGPVQLTARLLDKVVFSKRLGR